MNQMKTGKFIADMRKAQGLTQKELAEKLGMSDKTISKWECGNGMPDNSIMLELCDILHISVNELLSGERLSSENYSQKAEENIINLIQNTDADERKNQRNFITSLVGEIALIIAIGLLIVISSGGINYLWRYMDIPSLIIIVGTSLLMLLAAVKLSFITNILSGILAVSANVITLLYQLCNPASLGPHISVMCICIFYSAIIDLLLLPIAFRLKNKINE